MTEPEQSESRAQSAPASNQPAASEPVRDVPVQAGSGRPVLGRTVISMLDSGCRRHPNRRAYLQRLGAERWRPFSNLELQEQVGNLALGLLDWGLERGARAALVLEDDPEWLMVDLGCQLAGLIDVPIDRSHALEVAGSIVRDSEAAVLFLDDPAALEHYAGVVSDTGVRLVVLKRVRDSCDRADLDRAGRRLGEAVQLTTIAELCGRGRERRGDDTEALERLRLAVQPDDVATLVYTSGTTGRPKGVQLTHQNLSFDALTAFSGFGGFRPGAGCEVVLSFLPLAHVFARTLVYGLLEHGSRIFFSRPEHVAEDLRRIRPTLIATVPRMIERVYERIVAESEATHGWRGALARTALAQANRAAADRPPTGLDRVRVWLSGALVYRRWRAALGGRLRFAIVGGAALRPELIRFFGIAGIELVEGYGQTEASPVIAFNRPGSNRPGTVGKPLAGTEVVLREGEVLARGPHIMPGYWRNEEATRRTVDQDGWLHTGDRGELAGDCLRITGRIASTFKLSTGRFVTPEPIEQALEADPGVEAALVVGEGRKFCGALLFVSPDATAPDPRRRRSEGRADGASRSVGAFEPLAELVRAAGDGLEPWSRVQRFAVVLHVPTVEEGLLTPTLKLRRARVVERYAGVVEQLYESQEEAPEAGAQPELVLVHEAGSEPARGLQ